MTADPERVEAADRLVLTDREGETARVTINRPAVRNALNLELCVTLQKVFRVLDGDADVRVVLLAAAGPSFCAGADRNERSGRDAAWVRRRRLASFAAYREIESCSKPVVALLNGPVVGSGGEIAMSCDFAIAAADATFRFPEPHLGTIGATQRLQRVIGRRRAKELLFTGRLMDAEEAHRLGLVVEVVPPEELAARGEAIARTIAEAPALALDLTKQAVDLGSETDLERGIGIEMAAIERRLAAGDNDLGGPR